MGRAPRRRWRGPRRGRLLDLVATLLEPAHRTAATHYAAAEAYIRQRLRSYDLSAARIARGIGVSERHLSRIFAEEGTSVPRYIQQRRVELAERMLRAPSLSSESVERIAQRCGFASVAHFSLVFREHTGMPPSAARRRPRAWDPGH